MKAADALGLLAGLGALGALRGGREGTGKRFTGLLDMLDGGGAGASGDRFEGGGLLSVLGNLFAKPLEAQDNIKRIARDTSAITQRDRMSAAMADEARRRGLLQDALDPRVGTGASGFRNPMQGMRGFEPTNDQIAPPAAVSQMPVQGRTNLSVPGFSAPGKLRAGQLREPFGVQPPFRTDAIAQAIAQSQAMQDYPDMSMQPIAGVTTPMPVEPTSSVQSYKSDPQFMSVAEKDATFLSMPEAARQNIYNMYLQRRNMQ